MRIDFQIGPQPAAQPERDRTPTASGADHPSAAQVAAGEDQAQLSGGHIQVQGLAAQAAQLPEIRQEKVESLRQAVQSGQYHSNPEKVAGALLGHMLVSPAA